MPPKLQQTKSTDTVMMDEEKVSSSLQPKESNYNLFSKDNIPNRNKRSLKLFDPKVHTDGLDHEKSESAKFEIIIDIPTTPRPPSPIPALVIHTVTREEEQKTTTIPIQEIFEQMNQEDYWIPEHWPVPQKQRGHTCGLYALAIALMYGFKDKDTPPARKDGNKNIVSLRQIAKQRNYSSGGEIFNVHHFKMLADAFHLPGIETLQPTEEKYTHTICQSLRSGRSVIAACDLGTNLDFPGESGGLRTHWALIFGYYRHQDNIYFLVTQHNAYYVWPASQLLKSNIQLPEKNPRCSPHYYYVKDKTAKTAEITPIRATNTTLFQTRKIETTTLTAFRFGLALIPAPALKKSASLEDFFQQTKEFKKTKIENHTSMKIS